jgi:hypothetical protein
MSRYDLKFPRLRIATNPNQREANCAQVFDAPFLVVGPYSPLSWLKAIEEIGYYFKREFMFASPNGRNGDRIGRGFDPSSVSLYICQISLVILARAAILGSELKMRTPYLLLLPVISLIAGCAHPKITAYDLNDPKHPEVGMPYYLPKYYLVITKNVRYIPMPTIGLTQTAPIPSSFDTKAAPAAGNGGGGNSAGGDDAKGSGSQGTGKKGTGTNQPTAAKIEGTDDQPSTPSVPQGSQIVYSGNPGVVPATPTSDGLIPDTFYTYQFIALPDLTQKYGLVVKGGAGELRSTLNIVNGWMFTGPGPLYLRDSFTSENIAASGTAAQQITDSLAKIASMAMGIPPLPSGSSGGSNVVTAARTTKLPKTLDDYALIAIYEVGLDAAGKQVKFTKVDLGAEAKMTRNVLGLAPVAAPGGAQPGGGGTQTTIEPEKELPGLLSAGLKKAGWTLAADKINVKVAAGDKIDVTVQFADVSASPGGKGKPDLKQELNTEVAAYVAPSPHSKFSVGKIDVQ